MNSIKIVSEMTDNDRNVQVYNVDEITAFLQQPSYKNQPLFEYLHNVEYVRPYFDIDCKKTEGIEGSEVLGNAVNFITKAFNYDYQDMAISEASYDHKFSFHVILYKMTIKMDVLRAFKDENKKTFENLFIDTQPYGKGRQKFRMVKTSKRGKNAPLMPKTHKDDISKHLIQYRNGDEIESSIKIKPVIKKKPAIKIKKAVKVKEPVNNKDVIELVNILNVERIDDRASWIELGLCLYNISVDNLQVWINASKKSSKFKEGECEKKWEGFTAGTWTIGSLHYWAKTDNKAKYLDFLNSKNGDLINESLNGTNVKVAEVANKIIGHVWKYTGEMWFYFDGNRWIKDKEANRMIGGMKDVRRTYSNYNKKLTDDSNKEGVSKETIEILDEKRKKCQKIETKLCDVKYIEQIKKALKFFCLDDEFHKKLDSNIYLLGFDNGVYDLINKQFRKATPDDYITLSVGHEYEDVVNTTEEERSHFLGELSKIFTDEEVRDYIIDVYASCLNGSASQSFQINHGTGGNGKGMLKNWTANAMGQYFADFGVGLITQARGKVNQANAEMVKLVNKRYVICCEPSKNDMLNGGIIKEMTGGDVISCRGLFSGDDSFKPHFSLFMECNERPAFDSQDGGIERRFTCVRFNSRFVVNEEEVDINNNVFLADDEKKTPEDIKKMGRLFLSILLDRHDKLVDEGRYLKIKMIQKVKDETNAYFEDTNPFMKWMNDNLEYNEDNPNHYISLKDLFGCWSNSEECRALNKKQKPKRRECEKFIIKSKFEVDYYYKGKRKGRSYHPITKNSNVLDKWDIVD